jgi:type IV pilus assembly protein PilV
MIMDSIKMTKRNQNNFMSLAMKHRGMTLIEVLVALLIVSIGLLGLAALQANSLKFNHSAYLRTQATQLAYDMGERIRANREEALINNTNYTIDFADAAPTATDVETRDLNFWINSIAATLPNGDGEITRVANRFTITVRWLDDKDAAQTGEFQFVTEI